MSTYLDNPLNDFLTYTYNIKLYMINRNQFQLLDGTIGKSAVLIADNAELTQFNITSMEQIFTCGHGQVRETFGNKFSLKLQESNGAMLPSYMAQYAAQVGAPNNAQAGYLLAIEFNGRDRNNQPKKYKHTFYYACTLSKFDFKITEGGTTYNLDIVENSIDAYYYLINSIKEQITVEAATFGEFVTEFASKYNQSLQNSWAVSPELAQYYDTFEFTFHDTTEAWANWEFQAITDDVNANGVNIIGRDGSPKLQITINNGSNITAVFGQVLQLTAEYKQILATQKTASEKFFRAAPGEDTSLSLESFPTFFKILSNIEYGAFDALAGNYQKTITYQLKAYVVTNEIIDATAYRKSITNETVQNNRVSNLLAGNFMRKRYDYYYTGANTEIIEFDVNINYGYYYIRPHGGGFFGDPDSQSPVSAADVTEIKARAGEISKQRQELLQANNALRTAKQAGNTSAIPQLEANIAGIQLSLKTSSQSFASGIQSDYGLTPEQINYIVDFRSDVIADDETNSSDNDNKTGTLKFGAVKANLEATGDFVKIELGIRGDPYWMGAPRSLANTQRNIDELADFEAGSLSFFLNVNFPTPNEDINGLRKPSPDYQLSGVYTVVTVINKFMNGQFTQYLDAKRDLATNTTTAYNRLIKSIGTTSAVETARSDAAGGLSIAQAAENARNTINTAAQAGRATGSGSGGTG